MPDTTNHRLALRCARQLRASYLAYNEEFGLITRRARLRFEQRDWHAGQRDADERIDLYDRHVDAARKQIRETLEDRMHDRLLWRQIKCEFAVAVEDLHDVEFAKTYFSSVTRRTFKTIGVEPAIEFVGQETIPLRNIAGPLIGRNYANEDDLVEMFRRVLGDFAWSVPFEDVERCSRFVADEVGAHYRDKQKSDSVLCLDVLESVFYRDTRAYVIGKLTGWTRSTPIVMAFANGPDGVLVDAVIQGERGVRVMFGFARSYFHVDLEPVGSGIVFLRKIMPRHTVNELFTVLGRAKQGKTERFRGLSRHLQFSQDRFLTAPGKKGMVMAVFTLPSFDVVFKVMRDRFACPKDISHDEVNAQYSLVARINKSGRLVDAQEYRQLLLDRSRMEPALLAELTGECGDRVKVDGDAVVIQQCWVERRLRPLDLYLREVEPDDPERAIIEYGNALRELAATNVFPGDLLTKNFGVSSTGRVIFYDYDEVAMLTDCNFRDIPKARYEEDEFAAEPWFSVGPRDVFPEEFGSFLGFTDAQMDVFMAHHSDLLTSAFWRELQARHRAGEFIEVLPYDESYRPPWAKATLRGRDSAA